MSHRAARLLHLFLLWALVTLAAWPAFVLSATALALWSGEARQLDAWALEPGGLLLRAFLDGWRQSVVVAAPVGLVAVADYLLLSRYRVTWIVGGLLLPVAGVGIALLLYRDPVAALPTLAATGLVLAVLHRAFERVRQRLAGVR